MFYPEFRAVLGGGVLEERLLPQARAIVVHALRAARAALEVDPRLGGAGAFNVYGFDLMVDDRLNVKLIEVGVPIRRARVASKGVYFQFKFLLFRETLTSSSSSTHFFIKFFFFIVVFAGGRLGALFAAAAAGEFVARGGGRAAGAVGGRFGRPSSAPLL